MECRTITLQKHGQRIYGRLLPRALAVVGKKGKREEAVQVSPKKIRFQIWTPLV